MTAEPLTLRAGMLEAQILPAIGGSIGRFDRLTGERRQPLLRPAAKGTSNVLDVGCFPMVPFVNRIRGGTFMCDGREIRLAPNMASDRSPLHGQGWLAPWTVTETSENQATLLFRHDAGEWPWEYEATQRIELDERGMSLQLSCRNLSVDRMPCGLGFHPYYPCNHETVLDTQVASAWTIDDAVLPVANVPAEGCYDLRARRICSQDLDNGFDGWGGTATIRWPGEEASLRLSSPDAGRFQVYSPKEGGLFVAEPVQNANAALNEPQANWPALGVTLLEQGQTSVVHARFEVLV